MLMLLLDHLGSPSLSFDTPILMSWPLIIAASGQVPVGYANSYVSDNILEGNKGILYGDKISASRILLSP